MSVSGFQFVQFALWNTLISTLTHSWLYAFLWCVVPAVKSLRKVCRESHLYQWYLKKKKRYSPLIYTDPCHPSCHPHDTVLLKSVKTPSELHTSLDRGENQIWLNWAILSSSPTEQRAQVDVLLSSTMNSDCSELSGVGFMFRTSHSSRTASWSSRMLVREPRCVAATSSTVTH